MHAPSPSTLPDRRLLPRIAILTLVATLLAGCATGRTPRTSLHRSLGQIAQSSTLVIAHRGASATHPENTLLAYQEAVAAGADLVELDIYQTKDGELVCFHDDTLDRTTDSVRRWNRKGSRIADHTLAELSELDAGSWKGPAFAGTRIPTLEQALAAIGEGAVVLIEHKQADPATLVSLLRRLGRVDKVIVQSFDWGFLRTIHGLERKLTLCALGGGSARPKLDLQDTQTWTDLADSGVTLVHWKAKNIQALDIRALHTADFLVLAYTINAVAGFDQAIEMNLDAITTDRPRELHAYLKQ